MDIGSIFDQCSHALSQYAQCSKPRKLCCGTGATITPVGSVHYKPGLDDSDTETVRSVEYRGLREAGPVTKLLAAKMFAIQVGPRAPTRIECTTLYLVVSLLCALMHPGGRRSRCARLGARCNAKLRERVSGDQRGGASKAQFFSSKEKRWQRSSPPSTAASTLTRSRAW